MSRPRNTALPALRAPSGQDGEDAWPTPRADSRALVRIDYLEGRLQHQEKTTQHLIDRAYKIKEDIIDNLNITHGTWHEEKRARELLQEHIRTITDVVRKLSKDILYLEEQARVKEGVGEGAQHAVKTLEMHHVAGLTDLRGRVARCDASIARLSADLKDCNDVIRVLVTQQQDQHSKVLEKLHHVDDKMGEVTARLDRSGTSMELQLRHLESDSSQQLSKLDGQTRVMVEELRSVLNGYKMAEAAEREKLEARVTSHAERAHLAIDSKQDKLERRVDEALSTLSRRIHGLEEKFDQERLETIKQNQELEEKVQTQMDAHVKRQTTEVTRLKKECREGFSTVHESIGNMKEVLDGKRRLGEAQLKKEISQIRKMVVLI